MSIAATLITTVVGLMNFLAYSVTPAVARAFGRIGWRTPTASAWTACGLRLGSACSLWVWVISLLTLRCAAWARTTQPSAMRATTCTIRCGGIPPMMMILALMGTLRGLQDTVTPLKVAGVGTVVNVALNWVLIYPVGWGVAGSATGTSLTQWGHGACSWYIYSS